MHNGNPLLRGEREKIEYTPEMTEEFIKCQEDILYFAEKYFKIITIDEGETIIDMWDFQKKMLKAFVEPTDGKRHNIVLASRQIGKCVHKDTKIKIRNKKTKKIEEISIIDFLKRIKK